MNAANTFAMTTCSAASKMPDEATMSTAAIAPIYRQRVSRSGASYFAAKSNFPQMLDAVATRSLALCRREKRREMSEAGGRREIRSGHIRRARRVLILLRRIPKLHRQFAVVVGYRSTKTGQHHSYGWRRRFIAKDLRGGEEPTVVSVVSAHSPFLLSRIVLVTFRGPSV